MQIPIQIVKENGKIKEWVIIELQGTLESNEKAHFSGRHIGDLSFDKDDGTPILIIGHHALFGKEVKMEKPFGVLMKSSENSVDTDSEPEYILKAMVTKKLIFKSRPKPIVTNVPKKL